MEVDYPRVTHPFAGLLALAGFLPRLACVRHAASVRSEPGSNSPIVILSGTPNRVSPVTWSDRCADVTTIHSKHCGFRNLFRGPAIQFSRTERHCPPRTTDCRPRLRDGGALPTAVCASVSRPFVPARSRPPRLQGGRHVTPARRRVKRRSLPPDRAAPAAAPRSGAARGRRGRPPCSRGRGSPRGAPPAPARRPACIRAGTPRSLPP
jgi:hypothetical protein